MSEIKDCIIIKYIDFLDEFNKISKSFVLDEYYTKKFYLNPIYQFQTNNLLVNDYQNEHIILKKYFIKEISKQTYNIVKELYLVDDERELIKILDH